MGNSRNGHSGKTVLTGDGAVELAVPRDRNGSFEPAIVPKGERRLDGFDDRILSLYARGMTVREIQGHLHELYRVEVSPDLIGRVCPCGCGEMARIGEERSDRLDIVPARFVVTETVRPRYACNRCKGARVVQAAAPASLIGGGLPTEGLVAHVLIAKHGDHLPLYRQSQIYARPGLELHRATLADWVGKASFHLRPMVDCLAADLERSPRLGVDETPIRVLDPGRGRTKTGHTWTMVHDERPWSGVDPPGLVFAYAPGREGRSGPDRASPCDREANPGRDAGGRAWRCGGRSPRRW